MHNPFIANNNLDEIVFANRNKSYGAYVLRKEYDSKITASLGIVFGSMILLFSAGTFLSSVSQKIQPPVIDLSKEKVEIIEIDLEQLMQNPAQLQTAATPAAAQPASPAQTQNPTYVISNETPPVSDQPQTTQPTDVLNSPAQTSGVSNSPVTVPNGIPGGQSGGEIGSAENPYVITDVMPEFANGDLYEYLRKKMSYPDRALAAGKEGKVIVVFDVMPDGTITNVKIKKGIGFGCDEEALRVVSQMPAWKPGIMKGKAVLVRLHLPIQFVRE